MKNIYILLLLSLSFGTVTDIDGNVYETVVIGDQLWMAENLKATHYRNGDALVDGFVHSMIEGAYTNYDDDPSNSNIYGKLYNWYAVDDERGVCPEGFHVPSDDEWTILTDYLGGWEVAGGKMKTIGTIEGGDGLWYSPNTGATNESGFTGLPAGYLYGNPSPFYSGMGTRARMFSSTEENSSLGKYLPLLYENNTAEILLMYKAFGCFSIRCLSEEITTGCTDPEACNYDETATADDGSCAYEYDCAGTCGGDLEWDCAGICGGDNSSYDGCCGLPPNDDCTDDCVIDDLGQCCTPQDVDECGVCYGDDYSCTEFACVTDCQNFDDISGFLDNDCVVCDFLEDDAWNNVCSEDCGFDFLVSCIK